MSGKESGRRHSQETKKIPYVERRKAKITFDTGVDNLFAKHAEFVFRDNPKGVEEIELVGQTKTHAVDIFLNRGGNPPVRGMGISLKSFEGYAPGSDTSRLYKSDPREGVLRKDKDNYSQEAWQVGGQVADVVVGRFLRDLEKLEASLPEGQELSASQMEALQNRFFQDLETGAAVAKEQYALTEGDRQQATWSSPRPVRLNEVRKILEIAEQAEAKRLEE